MTARHFELSTLNVIGAAGHPGLGCQRRRGITCSHFLKWIHQIILPAISRNARALIESRLGRTNAAVLKQSGALGGVTNSFFSSSTSAKGLTDHRIFPEWFHRACVFSRAVKIGCRWDMHE